MDVIRYVVIRGRVQGVGYRAWAEYTALGRGLQGWARNRRDGTVEALFAGPPDVVAAMIAACKEGPRGSLVESYRSAGWRGRGIRAPPAGRFVLCAADGLNFARRAEQRLERGAQCHVEFGHRRCHTKIHD